MNEVRDEIEQLLIASEFIEKAPFWWVSVVFRLGITKYPKSKYQSISKKHGDLPISIELNAEELANSDRCKLKKIYTSETLKTLIFVGTKYNLPILKLKQRLQQHA